ncbi:MAG: DUF5703 domain-containing protein [Oscillospiraceae bacterium]|jgi:hypothetical protein|nr:DUF5703 domain-containing protein [Oscillospiraceae bacterium]
MRKDYPQKYNFTYNGLAKGPMDSVPIGNGELGANVWLTEEGLHILTSRIDALSDMHTILKTAHLLVRFLPGEMFRAHSPAVQLHLEDGTLLVSAGAEWLKVYADANYPVYRLRANVSFVVDLINHRKEERVLLPGDNENSSNIPPEQFEQIVSADVSYKADERTYGQYHRNERSIYDFTMWYQHLEDFPGKEDPLLNNTFGVLVRQRRMNAADVYSHCVQCADVQTYLDEIKAIADKDKGEDYPAHAAWWKAQWEKSYIDLWTDGGDPKLAREAFTVARGYTLQRYMNLCAGRGRLPIKFNGSIFTMEPDHTSVKPDFDYRRWGAEYWFQNTRLVYWNAMLAGDYEICYPFFKMYKDMLPLCEYRSLVYFGHKGCHIPETVSAFGTQRNCEFSGYSNRKGEDGRLPIPQQHANPYVRWHYNGMLELSYMALWFYNAAKDEVFRSEILVPLVFFCLTFFRQHFEVWDGKLRLFPVSSLETYQSCCDDTPDICGLQAVCEGVLSLTQRPDDAEEEALRALVQEIQPLIPDLPLREKDGEILIDAFRASSDGRTRRNCENPELYAVFPFFRHTLTKGDCALALRTFRRRIEKQQPGWQTDGAQAALLGLAEETWEILVKRFGTWNKDCAFPAFWGPNYDYTPDQDHGTAASIALILALVQPDGESNRLFPAWDERMKCAFRLAMGEAADSEQ